MPNYSVFDEKRVFDPGETTQTFDFRGIKIGIPICEDIWKPNVCNQLKSDGADIIITPNGSPYDRYKRNMIYQLMNVLFMLQLPVPLK